MTWMDDLPAQRAFEDGSEVTPTVRRWNFKGATLTYNVATGRLDLDFSTSQQFAELGHSGRATHDDFAAWLAIGALVIDPSATPSSGRQLKLQGLLHTEDTVASAQLRFWNLTNGYEVGILSGSAAEHDPELISLNVGVGAAVAGFLPNSASTIIISLKKSVVGDGSAFRALSDMSRILGDYS